MFISAEFIEVQEVYKDIRIVPHDHISVKLEPATCQQHMLPVQSQTMLS
jgi:hypothetical protein